LLLNEALSFFRGTGIEVEAKGYCSYTEGSKKIIFTEKNMQEKVKLFTFPPAFGIPDPSPFPTKVMAFLALHNIEFERIIGDVRKAPLKKIPFIEHAGKTIPDSELILDYLTEAFELPKDDLSDEQHAQGHMICRTLEERTYWCVVYYRWAFDESFAVIRETLLAAIPKLLRTFIGGMIQKGVVKTLNGQGLGRHNEADIAEFMRRDFQALSHLLGDKPYLFGDNMTRYDATAIGLVAMLAAEGVPTRAPDIFAELPNLRDYWERVAHLFPSEPV
jgi:glutathione S-transferase